MGAESSSAGEHRQGHLDFFEIGSNHIDATSKINASGSVVR
jgi:hypothetical protein